MSGLEIRSLIAYDSHFHSFRPIMASVAVKPILTKMTVLRIVKVKTPLGNYPMVDIDILIWKGVPAMFPWLGIEKPFADSYRQDLLNEVKKYSMLKKAIARK